MCTSFVVTLGIELICVQQFLLYGFFCLKHFLVLQSLRPQYLFVHVRALGDMPQCKWLAQPVFRGVLEPQQCFFGSSSCCQHGPVETTDDTSHRGAVFWKPPGIRRLLMH